MDVAALLEPRDEEAPSGENLEYDPVFTELELAAQPGEERQMGDEVMAGEGPDFGEVREKALDVLSRSHDLRAAVFLSHAELSKRGIPGFSEVLSYMRGCLEQYWETCHPELDEDDGDPMMRVNAIRDLCGDPDGMGGPSAIFSELRRAPLTESRIFGRLSLRAIQIAEGDLVAREGEDAPDVASIGAAFKDTDEEALESIVAALRQCAEDVDAMTEVFDNQVPGQGPDLDPLAKFFKTSLSKIGAYGGVEDAGGDEELDVAVESGGTASQGGGGTAVGGINSQNDVINALDRIMDYYKRSEPSSPLPLLLDRAKRLVNADFVTIIKDMAPSGVDNVNLIAGLEDEDDY